MTQRDLARAVNVREDAVSAWVRGTTKPRFVRMTAIAAALGVAIEDLHDPRPRRDDRKVTQGLTRAERAVIDLASLRLAAKLEELGVRGRSLQALQRAEEEGRRLQR